MNLCSNCYLIFMIIFMIPKITFLFWDSETDPAYMR